MLDRLFDFLRDFLEAFRFAVIVDAYEIGIVLRLGKLHKVMDKPGFYWIAPFYIDRAITDVAVTCAKEFAAQVVTLKDGQSVVVCAVVSYSTVDPIRFFLEVDDAEAALRESARGTIQEVLSGLTWAELHSSDGGSTDLLTKAVKKQAKRFGIDVNRVSLCELSKVRTYRFVTGS